jgi:hypothetical protein
MRIPLLSVLLVLAAAAPVRAQSAWTYRSDAGFALDLPAHWVRAPDQALAAMIQPGTESITYEAAFRLTDAPLPAAPFAAIARMDLPEPVTQEEFAAAFTNGDPQAEMQDGLDQTPAGKAGARAGVPRWDSANGMAWGRVDLPSNGTSASFGWTAMMLAPSGRAMIVLAYYGPPGADETAVLAEMKSIVLTLRAD